MRYQTAAMPLGRILPGATGRTNNITGNVPTSRPHLSSPAYRRRFSLRGGRAIQVTSGWKKNRSGGERKKKLRGLPWSSCNANTDFHPSLPVKPVSLDRNTQVLQQVECRTAKLFRVSSENYPPPLFFSPSIRLPELTFQPFCSLLLSLGKRWTLVLFFLYILIFALIVVFTLVVPDGFAQWYSGGVLWGNSWCKWG